MVWHVHLSLPVLTSQPRVHPGICSFMTLYEEIEAGVTTVLRTTIGGDWTQQVSALSQSREPRTAYGNPCIRSTRPWSPKLSTGTPVFASTHTRYPSPVPQSTRSSVPSVQ